MESLRVEMTFSFKWFELPNGNREEVTSLTAEALCFSFNFLPMKNDCIKMPSFLVPAQESLILVFFATCKQSMRLN